MKGLSRYYHISYSWKKIYVQRLQKFKKNCCSFLNGQWGKKKLEGGEGEEEVKMNNNFVQTERS